MVERATLIICPDADDMEARDAFYRRIRKLPAGATAAPVIAPPKPAAAGTYTCYRCRVNFAIRPAAPKAENTWCAEPGCRQRFWHGTTGRHVHAVAAVGIHPDDVPLGFVDLPRELPAVEGQAHEGHPEPRVLPRQPDAQLGYAVQRGGGGYGLSAIGELIPSHASEREAGRATEQPE